MPTARTWGAQYGAQKIDDARNSDSVTGKKFQIRSRSGEEAVRGR